MSFFLILFSRLKKHSVHHLIIPLIGGLLIEAGVVTLVGEHNKIVSWLGLGWFRTISLVLGVFFSWFLVMLVLINQEMKKRIPEETLAELQDTLNEATSYFGVSVVPLVEWFDPSIQVYLAKLFSRKVEASDFQHERTLMFFSGREYKNSRVSYVDENHYGRCLAHMHQESNIPLSFIRRKEIFNILDQLPDHHKEVLGCYPLWSAWWPLRLLRQVPLHFWRRRIAELDFALVTKPDRRSSVLRISKRGEELRIKENLEGDEVEAYKELVRLIKQKVYRSNKLRVKNDFVRSYGYTYQPEKVKKTDGVPSPEAYRKIKFDKLAEKAQGQFKVKRCTRIETISDRSGDVKVSMQFEGATAFSKDKTHEKLPMNFTSKSGFFCEPRVVDADGARVQWEWNKESGASGKREGFFTFDPPIGEEPVSFTMETETHNGIHFNRRDRQDISGSWEECVRVSTKSQYELYIFKLRFPPRHFPDRFKIRVIDAVGQRDYQEEKLAISRFAAFHDDSVAVLILEKPLPTYTYEIGWSLPKDDIDELGLSGHEALVARKATKRLLALRSDPVLLEKFRKELLELKDQIATATIGSYAIADPNLEVILHTYSDDQRGLLPVASNENTNGELIQIGRSTVGQAYRRRALVGWIFDAKANDSDFWDYGKGHSAIVSIPLFYPLDSGSRTCVISFASSSSTSNFLRLVDHLSDRDTRRTLTQHVNAWYAKRLASVLGLPDLSKKFSRPDGMEEK